MHCLILALSYSCSRANSECYLCEFCVARWALCAFLALAVITRIFIGIILISFSTPINFCRTREQKQSERKLLTQTHRIHLYIQRPEPSAYTLNEDIFLLMPATAHSFNCKRYNCTSEILWLMLIADVCFSYLPVICLPVNASLDFALCSILLLLLLYFLVNFVLLCTSLRFSFCTHFGPCKRRLSISLTWCAHTHQVRYSFMLYIHRHSP